MRLVWTGGIIGYYLLEVQLWLLPLKGQRAEGFETKHSTRIPMSYIVVLHDPSALFLTRFGTVGLRSGGQDDGERVRGQKKGGEGTKRTWTWMWTWAERFLGDHTENTHRTYSYAQRHRNGGEQIHTQSVPQQIGYIQSLTLTLRL